MNATKQLAQETHAAKYRHGNETFRDYASRVAGVLADEGRFYPLRDILTSRIFLPGGRVQSAIGAPTETTAFNCFVSRTIPDSMQGIMECATEAAETMRKGGGDGFDFSTIRPKDAIISTLGSRSSGAVSFMHIFNSVCGTVSSAGNRRGAMMGVLRVDHPDIEEFIEAKTIPGNLTNFNISVGVTDEFMCAVATDSYFELKHNGNVYRTVKAKSLFDKIMRATYDWAEPGILFLDTINEMNNLWYCEDIAATNPCGEQPLPPNGACLLGSFNLTKSGVGGMVEAMPDVVRAMDNVIDRTIYPLEQHKHEAQAKRRLGLGVTGLANYIESSYGHPYGSPEFLEHARDIFSVLRDTAYLASIELAKEKGPFPLFDRDKYCSGKYFNTLPADIQDGIYKHGIRNSHLISFAPTGTISLTAGNVSSGIEPVFSHEHTRAMRTADGDVTVTIKDYAYDTEGVEGRTANECTIENHLDVLELASKYSDSAVSKTINVGDNVTWNEFKDIYMDAWERGCKGVTTFRAAGKRFGILNDGAACYIDPETGDKECS